VGSWTWHTSLVVTDLSVLMCSGLLHLFCSLHEWFSVHTVQGVHSRIMELQMPTYWTAYGGITYACSVTRPTQNLLHKWPYAFVFMCITYFLLHHFYCFC
jgi:hypothetical protein